MSVNVKFDTYSVYSFFPGIDTYLSFFFPGIDTYLSFLTTLDHSSHVSATKDIRKHITAMNTACVYKRMHGNTYKSECFSLCTYMHQLMYITQYSKSSLNYFLSTIGFSQSIILEEIHIFFCQDRMLQQYNIYTCLFPQVITLWRLVHGDLYKWGCKHHYDDMYAQDKHVTIVPHSNTELGYTQFHWHCSVACKTHSDDMYWPIVYPRYYQYLLECWCLVDLNINLKLNLELNIGSC